MVALSSTHSCSSTTPKLHAMSRAMFKALFVRALLCGSKQSVDQVALLQAAIGRESRFLESGLQLFQRQLLQLFAACAACPCRDSEKEAGDVLTKKPVTLCLRLFPKEGNLATTCHCTRKASKSVPNVLDHGSPPFHRHQGPACAGRLRRPRRRRRRPQRMAPLLWGSPAPGAASFHPSRPLLLAAPLQIPCQKSGGLQALDTVGVHMLGNTR